MLKNLIKYFQRNSMFNYKGNGIYVFSHIEGQSFIEFGHFSYYFEVYFNLLIGQALELFLHRL
jgi:hypothetical protein